MITPIRSRPPLPKALQNSHLPGIVKAQGYPEVSKTLQDLSLSPPVLPSLPLTLFQPHGPPHCFSNTPGRFCPRTFAQAVSPTWNALPPDTHLQIILSFFSHTEVALEEQRWGNLPGG